ncbi:MAG: hypothetical protein Fur0021_30400 [Candidatus Promineifilaceae bacterium]
MNKNTLRNWGIVIALLIFSGIASVGWPVLRSQLGSSRGGPVRPPQPPLTISIPAPVSGLVPESILNEEGQLEMNPLLAMGVLGALVVGGIVVVGGGLAFVYTRLDQGIVAAKETETFQTTLSNLDKREVERLKASRSQRPSKPTPSHVMPRWSVISTSLIFILFAVFVSTAISDSIYPEGVIITPSGSILNTHALFILGGVVLTAVILGLLFRPQLLNVDQGETAGIPWDTIYVIITGAIFIVIGVGLVLWLNTLTPPG